jgi:hypothetical protein
MATGTIKFIEHEGQWQHASGTFEVYKITFNDGQQFKFNAKGEFKKNVGDTIEYQVTNTQYNTAKLIYPKPQVQVNYAPQNNGGRSADTQTQIVRQSMIKASVDYHAIGGEPVSLDIIKQTARELINFIETGN